MSQGSRSGEQRRNLRPNIFLYDEYAGAAVIQVINKILHLRTGIYWNRYGANLYRAEKCCDELSAVRHRKQNPVLGLESERAQSVPAAVDHLRQLIVTEHAPIFIDGDIAAATLFQIAINEITGQVELVRHTNGRNRFQNSRRTHC